MTQTMIADDPEAETPPFAAPRPRRRWLTWLILLLVAFVAGLFTMGYILTHWDVAARYLPQSAAVTAPAASAARAPTPVGATPPIVLAPSASALDGVDARVRELEGRIANIDAQAQAAAGNASRAEGLLIAFAARRMLDRGAPLGYLEPLLRERFGATQPQAVATVIAAARQPVTRDDLRAGLAAIGPTLVSRGPDVGWWDSLRRELGDLIVIRPADVPSIAPDDRLARARTAIEGGHVDRALVEVMRLPGHDLAAGWIAAARRYAASRGALDLLETAALTTPIAPAVRPPTPAAGVEPLAP